MEAKDKMRVQLKISFHECDCLARLGGDIEDHIVKAIEQYLSLPEGPRPMIFHENKPPFGARLFTVEIDAKFKRALMCDKGGTLPDAVSWYIRRNPPRRIENGKEVFTMNTVSGTAPRADLAADADLTAAHSAPGRKA